MMAERTSRRKAAPKPELVSPEAYSRFIGQIEVKSIWLAKAHLDNRAGFRPPRHAEVAVSDQAVWRTVEGGFDIEHRYELIFEDAGVEFAVIEVTFGLRYASEQPLTDEIFEVFRSVNLPLNTWPYLRAYVGDTTGRMGWLPFTLPALKRGTADTPSSDGGEAEAAPERSRRTRRGATTTTGVTRGRRMA